VNSARSLFAALVLFALLSATATAQSAGSVHPDWPHVLMSYEGKWLPAPGYRWVDSESPTNLAVRWEAGRKYLYLGTVKWPHVMSSTTEGQWFPDPGYEWVDLDERGLTIPGHLAVRWKPGASYWYLGSQTWSHVSASATEGSWLPEPGYAWAHVDERGVPAPGDLAVRWRPGASYWYVGSQAWPHVIASPTEGRWLPESGYEWAHLDDRGQPIPGDLAVASTSERQAAASRRNAMNERWANYLREIQADNAYPNWLSRPYDAFVRKQ
jgi:hypothetical protein